MAEVISGMAGALQGTVGGLINKGQNYLDYIFPPQKRAELWATLSKFATEKPLLASFILSQIALTGLPLGLFVIMTITVIVFSLLGALLLGLLGALVFIVFAVGFALLILLPTLFITTFAAAFIWLWGVGAYYIIKWFNQKEIPGIHTSFTEGLGLNGLLGGGETDGEKPAPKEEAERKNGAPKKGGGEKKEEREGQNEGSRKNEGASRKGPIKDVAEKLPGEDKVENLGEKAGVDVGDPKKAADVGKLAGKTGDVKKVTEGVTGGVL